MGPLGPQSRKMREGKAGTYFPAVQTAEEGEDTAGGATQPHVVSLQDKVTQLQAVQCLGLGCVQATHEAASADVNGTLPGERAGISREQHGHPPTHMGPGPPRPGPSPAPALRCHLKVAVLQDTPRTQSDRPLQQAADHRAPGPQQLQLL